MPSIFFSSPFPFPFSLFLFPVPTPLRTQSVRTASNHFLFFERGQTLGAVTQQPSIDEIVVLADV
jgi:hypothetical protein